MTQVGLPVASNKVDGLATMLEFLGIEFDTGQMIMHLPDQKLSQLKKLLRQRLYRKAETKCSMLSLIGELAHASGGCSG